ncbi:major capsid protein [Nitrospirillum sp. BR 11163]|uniref:major capsid protein n=1 Tax=Nitrospirillum sp. BR 11163 TaxID=3104323 RepID=UPI002AFFE7EC|nr:major capsid protein [Nitrospirillum sp. BR 11163]MEA1674094.1 major capsid protein [Nitrospirillum sp. BR 11163]
MDIYATQVLIRVVQSLITPSNFLLDMFFPSEATSPTEFISFDVVKSKRRIAPFCSPLVQGKVVDNNGFYTDTFKPAYIKDKRRFDPSANLKRTRGERIGGDLKPADRSKANLALAMQDQLDMLTRGLEVMAADALLDGKVLVQGEGFPTTLVDFQRDPSLSIALTGANRWGQAGVYPTEDLEEWILLPLKLSGAVVTKLVFTPGPWKLFKADQNIKDAIFFPRAGQTSIEVGPQPKTGGQYMGNWGNIELYLYNDWYIDPVDGIEKPILPDGTVIFGSDQLEGVQQFGAIQDEELGYPELKFAPKSWLEKDPAVRWLLTQSAPLTVPYRVNAVGCATVF